MKRILAIFTVLFLAAFAIAAQGKAAPREKRLDSSPPTFRTFFASFKNAVAAGDKTRVASMTRFPFKYGFDAGDEGTMSRAQFLKRFAEVFGRSPKKFLPERNPVFSRDDGGSFVISTEDAAHLIFVKTGDTFKFTSYLVEP